MSAVEDEIIRKVRKFDESTQRRILDYMATLEQKGTIPLGEWLKQAESLRLELLEQHGGKDFGSTVDLLNEMREERLDDLLGRS